MVEVLLQMVGEDHEPSNLVGGYVLVDPRTSTETVLSSKPPSINQGFSDASVQSSLFTHSWRRRGTYTIPDLCSYIASTPPPSITHLQWWKNKYGVKHEFLLLKVERPRKPSPVWLRLERRMHENAKGVNSLFSRVQSGDTVKLCSNVSRLFDASRSQVQVETEFTTPPPLQRLGDLLSILMEDSPDYKLCSENCYFFCAVIYENLVGVGEGMNTMGVPSKFSLSLATELKAQIKKRMDTGLPGPSPSIASLEFQNPLPTEGTVTSTPRPSEQLPNEVSATQQLGEMDPSTHNRASTRSWHSRFTGSRAKESTRHVEYSSGILMAPVTISQPGVKAPVQANTPQPYPHDSGYERGSKRSSTSLFSRTSRMGSWSRPLKGQLPGPRKNPAASGPVTLMRLPWISAPSGMVPKTQQPQGMKLYISVDFGATHSSVSYASSTNGKVIPIASWPGSSDRLRKIPTCLVYDDRGDLRAWGFRARDINLRRGWVRCEWFKLWLDLESAPSTICPSLPAGKQPADVIVDFLSSLWMYAKGKILLKHTLDALNFAEIYLTVPASWDARRALSLREAAVKAGLVVQVSRKDMYWQERLHIIPETKASAIHSVPLTQFLPDRKFMICDAGGGTIDIATYNVTRVWGAPEIAEVCLRSGAYCGSLFLDIYFRELVRARLADHPSHLDEASLAHFLLTFSGAEKLRYKGSVDDKKMFHFRCLHPQNSNHPSVGLENGELIIPGHVLRHEVFDPVINQVIRTINRHMLGSRVHVDALLLVGGFVQNEYLFQRIKDEFKSAIPSIIRPTNGDTASNCGAARSGLYPTVISVIPSHSVVMRVRLPAEPEDKRMRPASVVTTGRTQFSKNRLQYIIKKGIGLQKGTRVDAQVGKFSVAPSDNIFETAIYVDKTMRYTDQGETKELCVCRVDLKDLPDFKEQARAPTSEGFYTEFELGFEMDTAEIRGELLYKGRKFGAVTFHLRS